MATSATALGSGKASRASSVQDRIALAGRVLLAAIFVMSGLGKVAAPAATLAYMKAAGLPFAPVGLAGASLIELGGGLALILGYRTRLAATILCSSRRGSSQKCTEWPVTSCTAAANSLT